MSKTNPSQSTWEANIMALAGGTGTNQFLFSLIPFRNWRKTSQVEKKKREAAAPNIKTVRKGANFR